MSCTIDIRFLISKSIDGEVTADERTQVDDHLSECAGCRDFRNVLLRNEALLAGALKSSRQEHRLEV